MIYGIGIDLADLSRFALMQERGNLASFAQKVLTAKEFSEFEKLTGRRRLEFIAGRFSAKESYSKAYGTGIGRGVNFEDLEILWDEKGKPEFTKHPAQTTLKAFISISHTKELVMTEVILEKMKEDVIKNDSCR